MHNNSNISPATCPNWSEIPPMQGVTNAPPETPIIIKAETSFDCSGRCSKAKENKIENTFEQANPMHTINVPMSHMLSENINPAKASIATSMLPRRKGREAYLASKMAPKKAPPVRAAK